MVAISGVKATSTNYLARTYVLATTTKLMMKVLKSLRLLAMLG